MLRKIKVSKRLWEEKLFPEKSYLACLLLELIFLHWISLTTVS